MDVLGPLLTAALRDRRNDAAWRRVMTDPALHASDWKLVLRDGLVEIAHRN